jgi:hypothetical protein
MNEVRPPWRRIAFASVAGVVSGALLYLAAETLITFLLDQLLGRNAWQQPLSAWPEPLRISLLAARWGIVLAIGQWFSALISGWSRTVYFAAILQTIHLITIYLSIKVAPIWAMPLLVALLLAWTRWASGAAEQGRAVEAKRATPHDTG